MNASPIRSPIRSAISSAIRSALVPGIGAPVDYATTWRFGRGEAEFAKTPWAALTRTGLGTRVGPDGLVGYGPHNLLLQSQDVSNASWIKNGATTPTSLRIVESATGGWHGIRQAISTTGTGTFSFVATPGERNVVWVGADTPDFDFPRAVVNVQTGVVLSGSAVVTPYSGGGYQVTVTGVETARGWTIALATDAGTVIRTGDGVSGLSVTRLQVSYGPSDYIPTTTTARYLPRIDYDPVTLAARGLLVEGQGTNLSPSRARDWSQIGASSVTPNAGIGTWGTATADKLIESAVTNSFGRLWAPTTSPSTPYVLSMDAKQVENRYVVLNIYTGAASCWTWFDLQTGTVATLGAGATAHINPALNGYWRCELSISTAASGSPNVAYWTSKTNGGLSYAGTAGDGILIDNVQFEQGLRATSLIPNAGTGTAVRVADDWYLSGAAFAAAWADAAAAGAGTIVVEWDEPSLASHDVIAISDTVGTDRVGVWVNGGSTTMFVIDDYGLVVNTSVGSTVPGRNKCAISITSGAISGSTNGAASVTTSGAFNPTAFSRMGLAGIASTGLSAQPASIRFVSVRVLAGYRTGAALQALTA